MTHDDARAFIDRHGSAWKLRDPAALAANHAETGVVLSPMFRRVEGRAQIGATYGELFAVFPDWQLQYDEPFVNGNAVAVFFSVTATHTGEFMGVPGTGRVCTLQGVSLYRLDPDLLIDEERRVYDFTGLLIQLGVLRVRTARPG